MGEPEANLARLTPSRGWHLPAQRLISPPVFVAAETLPWMRGQGWCSRASVSWRWGT